MKFIIDNWINIIGIAIPVVIPTISFIYKNFEPGLFIKTNKNPLKQQVNTVSAGFALSPVGLKP